MEDRRIHRIYWTLRLVYGLVPAVAGLDKFSNLLVDWKQYLSPFFAGLLPVSPETFMHLVGGIEVAVGAAILAGGALTRLGAYVASAWMAGIALNLVTSGRFFDVAVRDLVMAVGAFSLAKLHEVVAPALARRRLRAASPAELVAGAQHPVRHGQ
jgi:uncharacterized membrane protein YphA (DoxX/SURF4 family)